MKQIIDRLTPFIETNYAILPFTLYVSGTAALNIHGIDFPYKDIDLYFYGSRFPIENKASESGIDTIFNGIMPDDIDSRAISLFTYRGIEVKAISPYDVIINKISGYDREKHKQSIQSILPYVDFEKLKEILLKTENQDLGRIGEMAYRPRIRQFKSDYGF